MRLLLGHIGCVWRCLCLLCLIGSCSSCSYVSRWQEAATVIATADSLDQNEYVLYDDTIALQRTIKTLDNPLGKLLMRNELGRVHYYMGRNLSLPITISKLTAYILITPSIVVASTRVWRISASRTRAIVWL